MSTTTETTGGFTDEERAAMKERARELKTTARRGPRADAAGAAGAAAGGPGRPSKAAGGSGQSGKADGESEVLAKIAGMQPEDRTMAERIHAIVKATAPDLSPRLWYGMPAYARDGKIICHFQDSRKFKTRYATLGFSDKANLDDGNMWPSYYALSKLTADDEARIATLVKKAAS